VSADRGLRRTKIVCTIGPASQSDEVLRQLLQAGMDVARLNMSHGTHETHADLYTRLRRLAHEEGRPLAILLDLCGPKIRTGELGEGLPLVPGQTVYLCHEEALPADPPGTLLPISYPWLLQDLQPGHAILLEDGLMELRVVAVRPPLLEAQVVVGGLLKSRKGVNFPGVPLSVPSLTAKDEEDLRFGLALGVDMVALSFVRQAADLARARALMRQVGVERPLVSKFEKFEAVERLEEVVEASDACMVARGDLGVEVPMERVPLIQKDLIAACRRRGRPVITATQMLESMIVNPRPTRAELTDIANAILDGTDALMLSGETAVGRYPVQAVQVMDRVARQAESRLPYESIHLAAAPAGDPVEAVALAACEIAQTLNASALLACTTSGRTARAIARWRPRTPILGITPEPQVARQMNLLWGVVPVLAASYRQPAELLESATRAALASGLVQEGQTVVLTAGVPVGQPTNMIAVQRL
jgi:pyruvate kinase